MFEVVVSFFAAVGIVSTISFFVTAVRTYRSVRLEPSIVERLRERARAQAADIAHEKVERGEHR